MIRPEKMTIKTQEALATAQQSAAERSNSAMEPEHLLLALLDQEGGLVAPLLQKIGADPAYVRGKVDAALKKLPQVSGASAQPRGKSSTSCCRKSTANSTPSPRRAPTWRSPT